MPNPRVVLRVGVGYRTAFREINGEENRKSGRWSAEAAESRCHLRKVDEVGRERFVSSTFRLGRVPRRLERGALLTRSVWRITTVPAG